jgi:hypothetical protein
MVKNRSTSQKKDIYYLLQISYTTLSIVPKLMQSWGPSILYLYLLKSNSTSILELTLLCPIQWWVIRPYQTNSHEKKISKNMAWIVFLYHFLFSSFEHVNYVFKTGEQKVIQDNYSCHMKNLKQQNDYFTKLIVSVFLNV